MKVEVLNGPNLGRLGVRQPEIYGSSTHGDLERLCRDVGRESGLSVRVRQTDAESEMLGWLHAAADEGAAVVLNAAAWTHTSIAVGDACAALPGLLIEVHISNVHKREEFRRHSFVSAHADGVIVGCGVDGYRLALSHVAHMAASGGRDGGSA